MKFAEENNFLLPFLAPFSESNNVVYFTWTVTFLLRNTMGSISEPFSMKCCSFSSDSSFSCDDWSFELLSDEDICEQKSSKWKQN